MDFELFGARLGMSRYRPAAQGATPGLFGHAEAKKCFLPPAGGPHNRCNRKPAR